MNFLTAASPQTRPVRELKEGGPDQKSFDFHACYGFVGLFFRSARNCEEKLKIAVMHSLTGSMALAGGVAGQRRCLIAIDMWNARGHMLEVICRLFPWKRMINPTPMWASARRNG